MSAQKSAKSLLDKESFLEVIGPKTLGCLWVTNEPIESREKPFYWFDYLLDGTLERHILEFPSSQKSFFTAQQFDKLFFVMQVESKFPNIDKAFKEAFNLFKVKDGQNKVLCLSQNPVVFSVPSIKEQKNLEFDYFIY